MEKCKEYFLGKINLVTMIQVFLAYTTPCMAYMGLSDSDLTSWAIFIDVMTLPFKNPYMFMVVLTAIWGVFSDPRSNRFWS